MALLEKIKLFFKKSWVGKSQHVLGEIATGLGTSWIVLMVFELCRPGVASLYLDLNLILVLALVVWGLSILGDKNI